MLKFRGTTLVLATLRSSALSLIWRSSHVSSLLPIFTMRRRGHHQFGQHQQLPPSPCGSLFSSSPSSESFTERALPSNDIDDFDDDDVDWDLGMGEHTPSADASSAVARGTVYFVSTPLGNLDDITVRALKVLRAVDVIAAEDTRRTGRLLQLLGIETAKASTKPGGSGLGGPILLSHHEHNTKARVPDLVRRAQGGQAIAVVSDAGTPGIADPGLELAKGCAQAGVPVVPVPGPCAAVAALSVAGFPCTEFVFLGFLPKRGSALTRKIAEVCAEKRTQIFYEAPHRVSTTVALLAAQPLLAGREVLFARELTKLHEEIFRGSLEEAGAWLASKPGAHPKGEFTVVLSAAGPPSAAVEAEEAESKLEEATREVAELVASGAQSLSGSVKEVARARGVSKQALYKRALGGGTSNNTERGLP